MGSLGYFSTKFTGSLFFNLSAEIGKTFKDLKSIYFYFYYVFVSSGLGLILNIFSLCCFSSVPRFDNGAADEFCVYLDFGLGDRQFC
jgi:hypothetical protein